MPSTQAVPSSGPAAKSRAAPPPPAVTADDALRAGKPPVGTGSSPLFAQLIALVFICLGVVGVQTLLVSLGVTAGTAWTSSVVDAGDAIKGTSMVVLVVGVLAIVLGLLLLPVVVRPRPRKGVALLANTGVHLRPRDLARIVESALDGTDAVTEVQARANRRSLRINATTVAGKDRNGEIKADINSRLSPTLSTLERAPRVKVTLHNDGI